MDTSSFWLGGLHKFLGTGQYEIQFSCKSALGGNVYASIRSVNMTWGWVDLIDGHSFWHFAVRAWNGKKDPPGQIVAEGLVDFIGDKLLSASFWIVVGFHERTLKWTPEKWVYNMETNLISKDFSK